MGARRKFGQEFKREVVKIVAKCNDPAESAQVKLLI